MLRMAEGSQERGRSAGLDWSRTVDGEGVCDDDAAGVLCVRAPDEEAHNLDGLAGADRHGA